MPMRCQSVFCSPKSNWIKCDDVWCLSITKISNACCKISANRNQSQPIDGKTKNRDRANLCAYTHVLYTTTYAIYMTSLKTHSILSTTKIHTLNICLSKMVTTTTATKKNYVSATVFILNA